MQLRKSLIAAAVSTASLAVGVGISQVTLAGKADQADRLSQRANELPARIEQLKLDVPVTAQSDSQARIDPALRAATGKQRVIVRLKGKPVARHSDQSASGRISRKAKVKQDQDKFLRRAAKAAPGSKSMARTQVVLNAVFMEMDASQIEELSKDRDVYSIHRVRDYQMDLSETVPYIGATAVQNAGIDGAGVKVAVLDSGIDYTHAALGGGGTLADYEAAWGTSTSDPRNTTRDGLFPTARVVDGYDFVGEDWPNSDEAPDEDPIDLEGHGTHVADIIGGELGVAPGVDLYAVKVCSAVSGSCSGMALIQGMDYAVDPNGDGDTSDAVDVINMSLGSLYGQPFDDDLSLAVDNASALGVLTVASAGNSGDKPYANGTPSSATSALSVAQTQVPSAGLQLLTLDGAGYPAVFQTWSVAPTSVISGPLQYGDGAGGNLNGCAPFTGSLAGWVVLVDRGACNFSAKISYISQAGGLAGIIGLVTPGAPFAGADGGERPIDIPGYMIDQENSNAFKASVGGTVVIDPDNGLPLVGQMVGSSSRGPQHDATTLLKPEIGAPGASISAIAGSGTGTSAFGGTSGAAPMVAGSAALLLQAAPELSPAEVKARLMNNGDTDIQTDPFSGLAPITRIGGGEVRADRALDAPAAAWDEDTLQGGLSFGFVDVDKNVVNLTKTVIVKNYSDQTINYAVKPGFRYEEDANSGAVSVSVPSGKVRVRAGSTQKVQVHMTIDGNLLPGNFMNSGSNGADPASLTANEFDGYLVFDDGSHPIHMPWHVLPRKAARVKGPSNINPKNGEVTVNLSNTGVGTAQNDAYSLIAVSPNIPEGGLGEQAPTPDLRAVGVNTIPVPAGFCSAQDSFLWTFAINTWERQQHLLPIELRVSLDIDRDGVDDYAIYNADALDPGTLADGRQVTYAANLETGNAIAFFFAEHATNTGNTVHIICAEQVGLSGADLLATQVDISVEARDFYNGGPGDFIDDLTVTPLGERFLGLPEDIPGSSTGSLDVIDYGQFPGNSADLGLLLFTNGDRGAGARGGATEDTEALILQVK